MYGLSDHLNIIPLTRLRALRHGSSRYSTTVTNYNERMFPSLPERRKTSAAARWKPAGWPAAANVAAISSISAIQRQPFRSAERAADSRRASSLGRDLLHSASN